jgi:transposase-like protein
VKGRSPSGAGRVTQAQSIPRSQPLPGAKLRTGALTRSGFWSPTSGLDLLHAEKVPMRLRSSLASRRRFYAHFRLRPSTTSCSRCSEVPTLPRRLLTIGGRGTQCLARSPGQRSRSDSGDVRGAPLLSPAQFLDPQRVPERVEQSIHGPPVTPTPSPGFRNGRASPAAPCAAFERHGLTRACHAAVLRRVMGRIAGRSFFQATEVCSCQPDVNPGPLRCETSQLLNAPDMAARKNTTSKSDQIRTLLAAGVAPADIAEQVGCSRNLVYVVRSHQGGARRGRKASRETAPAAKSAGRSNGSNDVLEQFLASVKELERERDELREVLDSIRQMVSRLA